MQRSKALNQQHELQRLLDNLGIGLYPNRAALSSTRVPSKPPMANPGGSRGGFSQDLRLSLRGVPRSTSPAFCEGHGEALALRRSALWPDVITLPRLQNPYGRAIFLQNSSLPLLCKPQSRMFKSFAGREIARRLLPAPGGNFAQEDGSAQAFSAGHPLASPDRDEDTLQPVGKHRMMLRPFLFKDREKPLDVSILVTLNNCLSRSPSAIWRLKLWAGRAR